MKPFKIFFISLVLSVFVVHSCFADPNKKINNATIVIGKRTYTLSQLKQKLKPIQVTIKDNPAYSNKKKVYAAFRMKEVLTSIFGINLTKNNNGLVLQIITKDNYLSQVPINDFITKGNAYLAYKEACSSKDKQNSNDGAWSPVNVKGKLVNPGPFYLVWDTIKTYPVGWPFQIISIKLINKNDQTFMKVLNPINESSLDKTGHNIFNTYCSSCHSLYYQGTLGHAPDLGMVTNYLSNTDIEKLVRNDRGYMPAIGKNFSKEEIKALLSYLSWVSHQSKKYICRIK